MNIEHTQEDVQTILQGLQDSDSDVIRSSAFAAGDARLVEAVESLCQHVQSSNIGVQEAAEYALRKIRGRKTIQKLLPLLRSEDTPTRNIAMDTLREIGCDDIGTIQPFLRDTDPDMRIFMADILGHTAARQAVPLLCDALLKDPEVNVRYQAAMSLGQLAYPEAVDALRQGMQDEEWVQFAVVESLTKIRADSTISTLVQALHTCSPLVASIIIDALGEMRNIKAVSLLFGFLEKTSLILRHKTVKAIVQILGESSLSLLSPKDSVRFKGYLEAALSDEDEPTLLAVLAGLSSMGDAASVRGIMDVALKADPERQADLYQAAVKALASIGYNDVFAGFLQSVTAPEVPIAIEACMQMENSVCTQKIIDIFWDLDKATQRTAIVFITQMAVAEDATFMLEILDRHQDSDILKNALYCLGVHLHDMSAQEKIFSMLDHVDDEVAEVALDACNALYNPEMEKRFEELFRVGDERQRMMAIYVLVRHIDSNNLKDIVAVFNDESPTVRQLVVEGLGQSGMDLSNYIDVLLPRLHDSSHDVRMAVVELLGASENVTMASHIITMLDDENEWVRIRAVEALGALNSVDAVPQLVALLEDAGPMLSFKVIDVLAGIGGNIAFKALLDLMEHEDMEIQQAATQAITKIKASQE